ncbi:MAG TPA: hypothetical protein VGB79_08720 [Allosphingosinicella sp.]|jgi:hypothetical protein
MASRYAAAAGRRNSPIDLPLAAVAALAVGFAAFVVPDHILSRIVEGSGLPSILSAAQPPLGTTARACIGAVAALATFGAVFTLLRLLGGSGGKAPRRERDRNREREPAPMFEVHEVHDDHDLPAPRLRRADIHPDAPARRPILAARELGEPDLRPPAPAPAEPQEAVVEQAALAPGFMPAHVPEPEPTPKPEPDVVQSEEAAEPAPHAPALDELELSGPDIQMIATEPVAAFEAAEPPVPADAAPAPREPVADATIADLMARLERGLARRLHEAPAAVRPEPVRAPEPDPSPIFHSGGDDRLRSAIENLQKMAARAG